MHHLPVMINEMIHFMSPEDNETYVDCTFGAGGYSRALLNQKNCQVYAIDRDPEVEPLATSLTTETNNRLIFIKGKFSNLKQLLLSKNVNSVDGIVLDLGVSSMQLDQEERGFSFMRNANLDMRMSKEGMDAYSVVNNMLESQLADIIYQYGEERFSRKIARRIVEARQTKPITTTLELAEIIRSTLGKEKNGKIDSATRTFQAIRIYVNDELEELQNVLNAAEGLLKDGGRLVVVSFHSLEDSIVKSFLRQRSGIIAGTSRYIPEQINIEKPIATFTLLTKQAIKPSEEEIRSNPRSRSARLRAAKRLKS